MAFADNMPGFNARQLAKFGESVTWIRGTGTPVQLLAIPVYPQDDLALSNDIPTDLALDVRLLDFTGDISPAPLNGDRVTFRSSLYIVHRVDGKEFGTAYAWLKRL